MRPVRRKDVRRRDLLEFGHRAAQAAFAAGAIRNDALFAQKEPPPPADALEQRIAEVMQAYDAQGNHRTGTAVDNASAEWLVRQARQAGADASLEPFSLSRVDPEACYLLTVDRRIDGVPVFDAGFTGPEGVRGKLGPLGSEAEIGLAESEPAKLSEPGIEQREQVSKARRSQHKAVVVLTRGVRPGLLPPQRARFPQPFWSTHDTDIQLGSRLAAEARCGARRRHARLPCETNRRPSLQRHRENHGAQSCFGTIGLDGAAQRMVAMCNRAREPPGLLAGSDSRSKC
jgi:hypothetical protein